MTGTDSQVLIVLDDLTVSEGNDALARIKSAAAGPDPAQLRAVLEEVRVKGQKHDSLLFLHQFAKVAAELGHLDRVSIHGLAYPDVICYLDPETVLTSEHPWETLINRWTRDAAPEPPKNLKKWLRREGLLPDDQQLIDEAIERGAIQMEQEGRGLHRDLVALGSRITELALVR
ncbi:UNVERIFIED_CONTAM: hypothetical protein LK11_07045 [Mumia flava]